MRSGMLCETADTKELYAKTRHEYTKYLLSSIPVVLGVQGT